MQIMQKLQINDWMIEQMNEPFKTDMNTNNNKIKATINDC